MSFDPERWAELYESPPRGQALVFRRSADVALEECVAASTRGERWVDVGCGTGHLAAELARAGLDVVGVDRDPRMVAFARERFAAVAASGALRFEPAAAERLPFAAGTLDGLVATSLAGLLDALDAFLAEAARVLRPGGTAVLTFTNRSSVLHTLRRAARRLRPVAATAVDAPVRLYTARRALRALEATGFGDARVRYYNVALTNAPVALPPARLGRALERRAGRRLGAVVARNFVTVARRSP